MIANVGSSTLERSFSIKFPFGSQPLSIVYVYLFLLQPDYTIDEHGHRAPNAVPFLKIQVLIGPGSSDRLCPIEAIAQIIIAPITENHANKNLGMKKKCVNTVMT